MSGRLHSRCRRVRLAGSPERGMDRPICASLVILVLALAALVLIGLVRLAPSLSAVG